MPVPAAWAFGPFAAGLDPAERRARLRCLRTLVQLHAGPRGEAAARALHEAEEDPAAEGPAVAALERLGALDRRHVLASYARGLQDPMSDRAARTASHLDGLWYLSPFDTLESLTIFVLLHWPDHTAGEARRAAAIFLELRRADYAYRLRTVRAWGITGRAMWELR